MPFICNSLFFMAVTSLKYFFLPFLQIRNSLKSCVWLNHFFPFWLFRSNSTVWVIMFDGNKAFCYIPCFLKSRFMEMCVLASSDLRRKGLSIVKSALLCLCARFGFFCGTHPHVKLPSVVPRLYLEDVEGAGVTRGGLHLEDICRHTAPRRQVHVSVQNSEGPVFAGRVLSWAHALTAGDRTRSEKPQTSRQKPKNTSDSLVRHCDVRRLTL